MPDKPVYTVKAHKEIVNCIDGVGGLGVGDGAPEIVTGSRDGECILCFFAVFIVMSSIIIHNGNVQFIMNLKFLC